MSEQFDIEERWPEQRAFFRDVKPYEIPRKSG